MNRATESNPAGRLHGTIAVSAPAEGYGFIEPDGGGGQLLVRRSSITSDLQLRVGAAVEYVLGAGSFAIEAVDVCARPAARDEHL